MNKIKLYITLSALTLLVAAQLSGQTAKSFERKALKAFKAQDFTTALTYNQALLELDSHRVEALFMAGEAARQLRMFNLAERYLERIPDSMKTGKFASTDFRLASVKKYLGKYGDAAGFYRKYISANIDTTQLLFKKAKAELSYCEQLLKSAESLNRTKLIRLSENVNTIYPDFAPFRFGDKLFFTSTWRENAKAPARERIFATIQDGPARFIPENTDKLDVHSSHLSLTADGKRMYYTICETTSPEKQAYPCAIFYRERNYEGDWTAPKRLLRNINADGFTTTQPASGRDKSLAREVLFFASDRPGGQGGMDIWCSIIEKDGTFGNPFPLSFNTAGDDVTPFFHQASQTLFFSSNGRESMGGFDIFYTKKIGPDTWATPENAGFPFNSSYDDLFYTFHSGSRRAYFASNRPGILCPGISEDCTSPDIFEAEIFVDLTAWTYSAIDSTRLNGVKVELVDKASNRIDTSFVNSGGNQFIFPLKLEKNYRLNASLDGFSTAHAELNTEGLTFSTGFESKLFLQPQAGLQVRTFNAIDSTMLGGVAFSLLSEATGETILHQNDKMSNEHFFLLKPNQKYSVTASKAPFTPVTEMVSTQNLEEPGRISLDLYLSPFEGLPLVLYFDNNQPHFVNPDDMETSLAYDQTFQEFLKRKNDFVTGYSSGLSSDKVEAAQVEIRSFFDEKVEANFTRLQQLCRSLEIYLGEGKRLEIEVEGYASPLASPVYNQRLTARRISSLINYFKKYNNGVLKPYFDNGQLVVNRVSRGEESFKGANISDDKRNARLSVFSPAASELRRVTITNIKAQGLK